MQRRMMVLTAVFVGLTLLMGSGLPCFAAKDFADYHH